MNDVIKITTFKNVSSAPIGHMPLYPLGEALVPDKELRQVCHVSRKLKEQRTEAYTLCTFKTQEKATKDNIDSISGLSLDFDEGHSSFELVEEVLSNFDIEFLIHTTANYRAEEPRLRVIIPYAEPLCGKAGIQLHKQAWFYFNNLVGPIDPAGKNPVQKWLFPKYGLEGEEFLWSESNGGHRFDPSSDLEPESAEDNAVHQVTSFMPMMRGEADEHESEAWEALEQQDVSIELSGLLARIDPDLPHDYWYKVLFASLNHYGLEGDVINTLLEWSASGVKFDEGAFWKKIDSHNPDNKLLTIGTLYYLSSQFPYMSSEVVACGLPDADDHRGLTDNVFNHAERLLRSYNNDPAEDHLQDLKLLSEGLARGVLSQDKFRLAFPLFTGFGKTTAIKALILALQKTDRSIVIATERIAQQKELFDDLVKLGVDKGKIGIYHNSEYKYEDIPSIPESMIDSTQFLLITHSRVKGKRFDLNTYNVFVGEKRDLVIWDESLLTTNGDAIAVENLIGEIERWLGIYYWNKGGGTLKSPELLEQTQSFLNGVKELLHQQREIGEEVFSLPAPFLGDDEAKKAINAISPESSYLHMLMQWACETNAQVRMTSTLNKPTVLQFFTTVPDELDQIIVLDASAQIKKLMQLDNSIKVVKTESKKNHSNVCIHWGNVLSSKSKVTGKMKKRYHKEVCHIIEHCIPEGEKILIIGFKGEKDDLFKSLPPYLHDRITWLHWGNHKAINTYSHIKYVITMGVLYRDQSDLVAQIVAQSRNEHFAVNNWMVNDIQHSEQADMLYQGFSRGNCRQVSNGLAGDMDIYLLHPMKDYGAIELLKEVMPEVQIVPYTPVYLEEYSTSSRPLADKIIEHLDSTGGGRIPTTKVVSALGINPNDRIWRQAKEYIVANDCNWDVQGRSFVNVQLG